MTKSRVCYLTSFVFKFITRLMCVYRGITCVCVCVYIHVELCIYFHIHTNIYSPTPTKTQTFLFINTRLAAKYRLLSSASRCSELFLSSRHCQYRCVPAPTLRGTRNTALEATRYVSQLFIYMSWLRLHNRTK